MTRSNDALFVAAIAATAAAIAIGGCLYLGLLAALLLIHGPGEVSHLPRPEREVQLLLLGLFRHPDQPWPPYPGSGPNSAPPVWLLWTCTTVVAAAATGLGVAARRAWHSWSLAGRVVADSHGDSRWAVSRDRGRLGRAASPASMHPDGIVLGWFHNRLLQTPREDNCLLLGVQRSGKTATVVVPTLLGWRGSVVATSTKEELVRLTGRFRQGLGPVHVFAPLDTDSAWIRDLGLGSATWNPVSEADSAARAAEIADLFTSEHRTGSSSHWYLSAGNLIAGLLLKERGRGGDLRQVLRDLNELNPAELAGLELEGEDPTARELLRAFARTPDREAGSIASTARSSLSLWLDERVARATSSAVPSLDLDCLLEESGTLYLVAPAEEAERCRPLFSALLQSILRRATARARRQGGVSSPRLLLALDEMANFARIPRLAGYVSSGPGQGIQLLLAFHDLAQIEEGYGYEQARTIWNNCRARLLLPGQGDLRTLDHFSRAIGETTRLYESPSRSDDGRRSRSEQRTGRPLASPDALRRLGRPVLLYADAPPARLAARRWDQVPAWRNAIVNSLAVHPVSSPKEVSA